METNFEQIEKSINMLHVEAILIEKMPELVAGLLFIIAKSCVVNKMLEEPVEIIVKQQGGEIFRTQYPIKKTVGVNTESKIPEGQYLHLTLEVLERLRNFGAMSEQETVQ